MSFDEGEMFFDEYVNSAPNNEKKREYSDELPPPYPPTMAREKPETKPKSKTDQKPLTESDVSGGLENALDEIVKRLTIYGEQVSGKPKERLEKSVKLNQKEKVMEKEEEEKEEEEEEENQLPPHPRDAGRAEGKPKTKKMDEDAEDLKVAMNEFLSRLSTLGLKEPTGEEKEEEEVMDESQWKEAEKDVDVNKKRKSVYSEEFTARKSGYSPLSHREDGVPFKDLSDRVKAFYMKFDRVKLIEGVGHIVEWALENGEEKLNKKLQTKYGADLDTFEEEVGKGSRGASKGEAEWATDTSARMKEKKVVKVDDGEMEGEHEGLSAAEKDKLIDLIKRHEASNLERRIYKAVKYAKKNGVADLNRRLLGRYGENLEEKSTPSKVVDLNDFGVRMLHLFYSKYDPVFVEKGGLAQVRIWTRRNGIHALDHKLKRKYKESLMEFSNRAAELESALRMFYKLVDAQRSKREVDQVVTWGLINGVSALNRNLREKYGKDLTEVDGREWTKSVEVFV